MFQFKTVYINEFVSKNLSKEGYEHLIKGCGTLVERRDWGKITIVSEVIVTDYWTDDEKKELVHQFFVETYSNEKKLNSFKKIAQEDYIPYFKSVFRSFVFDRISEEQQKRGLSYEKCKELVLKICAESYHTKTVKGKTYMFYSPFDEKDIKNEFDFDSPLEGLLHYKIPENTKHYKPLVEAALENVFSWLDYPIEISKMVQIIFNLFELKIVVVDQSFFTNYQEEKTYQEEFNPDDTEKYQSIINKLLVGVSKRNIQVFSEHFNDNVSYSDLAEEFGLTKSNVQKIIKSFTKKFEKDYLPENEEDGKKFLNYFLEKVYELAK